MNITEYISSGILEQYVSGTVSAQERQEVECMSHIYPEIKTELLSLQNTMEAFATSTSVEPPAHLRAKVLDAIKELSAAQPTPASTENIQENRPNNIVPMRSNVMRIAASVLLIVSASLGYLLYQNNQQKNNLANEMATIKNTMQSKEQMISSQKQMLAVVQNPDFKKVNLTGIPAKSPASSAVVYWNPQSKDVYITLMELPTPANDKQYQLWAIADGKPVDMGMLDKNNTDSIFQKMKTIGNATAFAITLENKGGVPSPTMSEMYVMGGI